jgi:hypothetical protein
LGFDYAHLAAVTRPTRTAEITQPPGQVVVPILWSVPVYSAPPPQPTIIVLQQPPPVIVFQPPLAPAPDAPAAASAPPPAAEAPRAPLRDLREFTLVRRDGTTVQAVAFSVAADRLIYITNDGIRRSFPLADLDPEKTRQANDADGAAWALPN